MPTVVCAAPVRVLLLLTMTALAGCGSPGASGGPGGKGGFGGPIEVGYLIVTAQEVNLKTELTGRISALRTAEVRPQVDGVIQSRLFEEGAQVKAGQPLYQIDAAPFEAAVRSAEAHVASAAAAADTARGHVLLQPSRPIIWRTFVITVPVILAPLPDITVHIVKVKPVRSLPTYFVDRKSTRLNSSHIPLSRMPSSA